MKTFLAVLLGVAIAGTAFAQTNAQSPGPVDIKPSCKERAADRKLAGAAFNSL